MQSNAKKIKEIEAVVDEIISRACCTGEIQSKIVLGENDTEKIIVNIASPDAQLLIGNAGRNLIALEHLARIIANKQLEEQVNFSVDVNDYREGRKRKLENIAKNAAKKAKESQAEYELEPMTSYERRIIHKVVAEQGLQTVSRGEGRDRHIVILPKSE